MSTLDQFQNSTRLVDRAISLRLPVFFCHGSNKRPTCPHGFYDATDNPDEIRALLATHGGTLIATPTGAVSGYDALDIDSAKHPETTLDWLDEYAPRLPYTRRHATRSGGQHFLFKHREGLRCSTSQIAIGIDVRAEGGYIIHWPSHGYGANDAPLADWPDWLFELAKPKPIVRRSFTRVQSQLVIDAAIDGILAAAALAVEGTRGCILFWAAARLGERVAAAQIESDKAFELLLAASEEAGYPEREALKQIERGLIIGGEG